MRQTFQALFLLFSIEILMKLVSNRLDLFRWFRQKQAEFRDYVLYIKVFSKHAAGKKFKIDKMP